MTETPGTPSHESASPPETGGSFPDAPPRFPGFNGLRAIAALLVVGVHTTFVSGITLRTHWGTYTSRLELGVTVFFLISGFLLYRPFAEAHLAGVERPRTGAFWIRRLLRIVPAYWTALFILTTLTHISQIGPGGWRSYLIHYFFLQIYFPTQFNTGISQAWSLCVEMTFYLFVPLYAMAVARHRDRRGALSSLRVELRGLVTISLLGLAWSSCAIFYQHRIGLGLYLSPLYWLPAFFDVFALGMMLAVLSAWTHRTHSEPRWLTARWVPWLSWALAFGCFIAVAHLGLPLVPEYEQGFQDIARQYLYGLFALFLLIPAVFGPQDQGLIRRFLRSWPIASIGVISYAIYLWHQAVIHQIMVIDHSYLFDSAFWPLLIGTTAISIAIATASYFVIERPALTLKRSFSWWKEPGVVAALESDTDANDPSG